MKNYRRTVALPVAALLLASCSAAEEDPSAEASANGGGSEVATDVGVTQEPCVGREDSGKGCIYLGQISDMTVGPFASLAVPATDAIVAFWERVNDEDIIQGYDVDVETFLRDNQYNPELHFNAYLEMRDEVLAIAQTLGSPTTAAIMEELVADGVVAAPLSWTSANWFSEQILPSASNYCFEAMNNYDYLLDRLGEEARIGVLHYAGDYGDDGAGGARAAAEFREGHISDIPTEPGPDNQGGAVSAMLREELDAVILFVAPGDALEIIGETTSRGFDGLFVGAWPTWDSGNLESPLLEVLEEQYLQSGYLAPFGTSTPGHDALYEAVGDVTPNDGYVAGWSFQYPLLETLQVAVARGDLTRGGVAAAITELESVDYEGMLPDDAGNFAAQSPNEGATRATLIRRVDRDAPFGLAVEEEFFVGPSAAAYSFEEPCF